MTAAAKGLVRMCFAGGRISRGGDNRASAAATFDPPAPFRSYGDSHKAPPPPYSPPRRGKFRTADDQPPGKKVKSRRRRKRGRRGSPSPPHRQEGGKVFQPLPKKKPPALSLSSLLVVWRLPPPPVFRSESQVSLGCWRQRGAREAAPISLIKEGKKGDDKWAKREGEGRV